MDLRQMLEMLDDNGIANLRRAVEIGRWPDGSRVDSDQREVCMQALIAYEVNYLPEEERSSYLPESSCGSSTDTSSTEDVQNIDMKKLH